MIDKEKGQFFFSLRNNRYVPVLDINNKQSWIEVFFMP